MILDRVENDEYILQNTLFSSGIASSQNDPLLKISRKKRYFTTQDRLAIFYNHDEDDYVYKPADNEFIYVTSTGEKTMNKEEWYLLPTAFSITLTPN